MNKTNHRLTGAGISESDFHPRLRRIIGVILTIPLFIMGVEVYAVPVISVDLDASVSGIQTTRTLDAGNPFMVDIVYTGDGETVFDTFTLDVVFNNASTVLSLTSENPTAGPTLALDVFGALPVTNDAALAIGSFLVPQGFDDGLGGVGISSVGGTPFPLVDDGETISLFHLNLNAAFPGTSTVANTGFPFGANAELALAGAPVLVTLQPATLTVTSVPLPPALWLFATAMLSARHRTLPINQFGCLGTFELFWSEPSDEREMRHRRCRYRW